MNEVESIRQPQHHGVFYPADPLILQRQLNDCLHQAAEYGGMNEAINARVKAIVVPHAGYDYSAHIAAQAYAVLRGQKWIKRIVILAPNHQTATAGGLLCDYHAWKTPLGAVTIDQQFIQQHWAELAHVSMDNAVHQAEYSIEVQLPFVQSVLAGVPVAPVLLGECTPQQTADILHPAWDCSETLLVVSSDLYHYLPRISALHTGMSVTRAIEQNDSAYIGPETACGYVALSGVMQLAVTGPYYWRTLTVSHSGKQGSFAAESLVGYGAFLLIASSTHRMIG